MTTYKGFTIRVTNHLTGYGYEAVGEDGAMMEVPQPTSGYGTTFLTPEAAILAAKKAIGSFWNGLEYEPADEGDDMNTELTTAKAIYREIYGDIDNKVFKAEKIGEIESWLKEGEPSDDLPGLIAEWREHDVEEIEQRNA